MIYYKTQGSQNYQNDWKKKWTKILKCYRKYRNYLYLPWSPLVSITLWHLQLHEKLIYWYLAVWSYSILPEWHSIICSVVLGFIALERSLRVFHSFSIRLRSGLWGGQSITVTFSAFMTTIALWYGEFSCMNTECCLVEFLSTGKTWSLTSCL